MSALVVILTDLFPSTTDDRPAGERAATGRRVGSSAPPRPAVPRPALPRLPSLEMLLARARRERLAADWRSWLAHRFGVPPLTPAALVARAWNVQSARAARADSSARADSGVQADSGAHAGSGALCYWLATPVHLFASIDRVRLHPAGLLCLSLAEQRMLVEQFAAQFGDSPWHLHALAQRELLLAGPALSASGADPARFLGADPSAGLPRGAHAAALRRLGSELELWLHEHALNRERARRGELPVTTLWLWGGDAGGASDSGDAAVVAGAAESSAASASFASPAPAAMRTARGAPHLYGTDTYVEALARLLGGQCRPLDAATAAEVSAAIASAAERVIVYAVHASDADATGRLELLERQWLAPALAALRAGHVHALLLVAGDHVYHLGRWGPWRLWRAYMPWWEVLA